MNSKKAKMIILSGPSGVGKDSVCRELFKNDKLHLKYSVSMTTRKKRPGEVEGVDYFFVDRETFLIAKQENKFIESAEFIGNFYGTPREYVSDELSKGFNVLLEIEADGATQVLKQEDVDNYISIFLMPPSLTELKNRLYGRGTESEDVVKQRLNKALLEIPLKYNYQYVIENDNVLNARDKIADVLIKENITSYEVKESKYYNLKQKVKKIVDEKYIFFVENWSINLDKINSYNKLQYTDFRQQLIDILTDETYHKCLARWNLNIIDNYRFVEHYLEKLMLKVNFYKIDKTT